MTETQRAPEGLSSKPRIRPAEAGETRPLSISARLGRLQFHTSGKFRVLQVADIQAGAKVAKDTIRLIGASLDAVRPDLVVFTGNQIAGYDPAFAPTFRKRRWSPANEFDDAEAAAEAMSRTRDLVQSAIGQFLQPLIDRKVPFAVTYGNHDFQCGLDNAELDAIYRGFPGCVNPTPGVEADVLPVDSLLHDQVVYPHAVGTFALPVADPDNKRTVLGLVILDSGDYVHGGGFSGPSEDTLGFLREVPRLIGAKSGVFQHLPLPEYYGLLKPVSSTTAYAMQGYRGHASQYYVLDEEKVRPGGYLGEGISCPDESDEFAILSERDATDAPLYIGVATGHDHRNGFVGELDGVLMTATPTCGFDTYGPAPAKRATRLIEFDIRHPYEPRTQLLEFGELVGKPSSKKAYTYALNAKPPQEGEGDDLLRKPSLWAQIKGLFS
ncbi:serine/threonine protein phosphatase [Bifidobacterium callitrichos]|uniref:Serine/threonine protein phosphatase n=1 Tax=Bifidobacterium callitrichos TaxID=762209 RepID=A0A2T3GA09_9BIFI|nr:metallophosphoesterase [Bifidobacterium callitrichos]KAA8816390.1 serine/threonine protein phosphatase [Bifidobacterium callitrichos]PST46313.1 serine/threonine protein phosphatase [Bifidobacterium callitrichos]